MSKSIQIGVIHEDGFNHMTIPLDMLNDLVEKISANGEEVIHSMNSSGTLNQYKAHAILIGNMKGKILIDGNVETPIKKGE